MRCVIVTCVFPPEPVVSAKTSNDIAHELVACHHNAKVIAPWPNRPAGKLYPGFSRRLFLAQPPPDSFEIVRCFSFLSPQSSVLGRLAENLSFGLTSAWQLFVSDKPNVVYVNTWPIVAAGLICLVARLRRIPTVISVQDVYPESLFSQNRFLLQSHLAGLLRWMDRAIARSSQDVIVISERFAQIYRDDRQVPAQNVHVVPNWVDEQQVVPDEGRAQLRAEVGVGEGEFLLVYGGNIGAAAGVEGVIEAMGCLPAASRPHFLIAGSGASLAACRSLASAVAPGAISFYTPWPAEKTSPVYAAADLLVLPTQGAQSLVSVPSKLIGYMLSARPIIAQAMSGSDLAGVIGEAGCGWVVEPNQPERLADAINSAMRLSPAALRERGQAGRVYALRHFTRTVCLPQVIAILEEAARSDGR